MFNTEYQINILKPYFLIVYFILKKKLKKR